MYPFSTAGLYQFTSADNKPVHCIPVLVLTGFLGSGKTTLLNKLLVDLPYSAVIINEFGATPIDQQLLREHNIPLSTIRRLFVLLGAQCLGTGIEKFAHGQGK